MPATVSVLYVPPPLKKLFPVKFVFAKGLLVALIDVLVCWTLNKFVSVPVMCSGVPLCAWHSTGVPVRQPAADIRDVTVFTLLTPRHCRCRRLVGLPLATVPFQWLQRGHGTVCHQRLGPAAHFWYEVFPFCHIQLTWRCQFRPSADVFCSELYNSSMCKLCKVLPQLFDGSTIILTFLVVLVAVPHLSVLLMY